MPQQQEGGDAGGEERNEDKGIGRMEEERGGLKSLQQIRVRNSRGDTAGGETDTLVRRWFRGGRRTEERRRRT